MILVYTAGPYTLGDKAVNIHRAREIAMELWLKGYAVICPHTNSAWFDEMCTVDYNTFLAGCLRMVEVADALLMLPGWTTSHGAKVERKHALTLGIPVFAYPDLPPMNTKSRRK